MTTTGDAWQNWARLQALTTGITLVVTGCIGCIYPKPLLGIYAILVGVLLLIIEKPLVPGMQYTLPMRHFWVRSIVYLLLSVPTWFQAPTVSGGLFMGTAAITYLVASIKGEMAVEPKKTARK